jgi:hypothetical protein
MIKLFDFDEAQALLTENLDNIGFNFNEVTDMMQEARAFSYIFDILRGEMKEETDD